MAATALLNIWWRKIASIWQLTVETARPACIGGHPDTVKLLLLYSPPLELVNMYGGTVLGQTLWSAAHGGDPDVYITILELLHAAGAKIPERHVPVNARVDVWLE